MNSVKDLTVLKKASKNEFGEGIFTFTDRYSVFDFGEMPDKIPGKGESLCRMSAFNFRELKKQGIENHLIEANSKSMKVKLVQVLFPQKGELRKGEKNYLIPLELIFRNSLPKGSSVFKRIEKNPLLVRELGLSKAPKPGEKLVKPLLDVSTKLEPTDRYLSWKEAQEISLLSNEKMNELKKKLLAINDFLKKKAESIGIESADGKVEFAVSPKEELVLVDVVGTLDENRFLFQGVHLSKQVLRDYYKTTPWAEELEKAKARKAEKANYPKPAKAPKELIEIVSNMYKSVCEAWTGEKVWNAPSIEEVVNEYKAFLEK
ncbi:MAG TPA: phosphoribosylaminoimidazolesuccinocarboxamide synthase [archaeon]|nr:phosphoribosylaminoimidazolesuccinocarboxamide synthase [archaeon]